ncbi:MAG: hypothetical protein ACYCO9_02550 [Streptosporangiaceae bacterium]
MTQDSDGAQAGDSLSLEMVAAALRADSSDIAIYANVLTQSLGESLPPGCVTVERSRSMADRMQNRPGTVTRIVVRLGEKTLTLGTQRGAPVAEICHEVRGIVLSRTTVPIAQWAAELAASLVSYAEQNAAAADALRRLVAGG